MKTSEFTVTARTGNGFCSTTFLGADARKDAWAHACGLIAKGGFKVVEVTKGGEKVWAAAAGRPNWTRALAA
jgi:hypothetical protein